MLIFLLSVIIFILIAISIIKMEYYVNEKHNFKTIKRYKIPYYRKKCINKKIKEYIRYGGYIEYLLVEQCKDCGLIRERICQDYDCSRASHYPEIKKKKGY